MPGIQFPYVKKNVANDTDKVDEDDHNKQEDQLLAVTAERGGTWANDAGRPTPTLDAPHPKGYNETRNSYEFWNGSVWVQTGGALAAHATLHEDSGADEINVAGLSGELADPQPPKLHGPDHEPGGADEITVTAGSVDVIKIPAIKASPGTINKGQVVYVLGWDDGAQAAKVELARSDLAGTLIAAVGIAAGPITDAAKGDIIIVGRLSGLNTASFALNDRLYVSPTTAGALTTTRPTGTGLVLVVAQVIKVHATLGIVAFAGMGWGPNDLPNLPFNNLWIGNASGNPILIPIANVQAHAPQAHAAAHEGGSDPVSVVGIGGDAAATPRPPLAHRGSHISAGTDPFLSTDFLEAIVKRIRESGGPTDLLVGAIPDSQFLKRSATALVGALPIVDHLYQASEGLSTTTLGTFQTKVVLVTGALTGTYLIGFHAHIWNNNKQGQVQLYNVTTGLVLSGPVSHKHTTPDGLTFSGFIEIPLTGSSETLEIQFRDVGGGTQSIQQARLVMWRVA